MIDISKEECICRSAFEQVISAFRRLGKVQHVERPIGSLRRKCLGYVILHNERLRLSKSSSW